MYDHSCTLVKMTISVSDAGDPIESVSSQREIFCRCVSSNAKEKSLAESRGKTADMTIILADPAEYDGELYLTFGNTMYKIIDSYGTDTSFDYRLVVSRWERA